MTTIIRLNLIRLLHRASSGAPVTISELLTAAPDLRGLEPAELAGWQCLNRWAEDDDARARDPNYAAMSAKQMDNALQNLEALEGGYDLAIGEQEATRMMAYACLSTLALVAVCYYLYRYGLPWR